MSLLWTQEVSIFMFQIDFMVCNINCKYDEVAVYERPKSYYGLTVFAHSLSDPEYRKTSNSTQLPIQIGKAQRELLSVSLKLLKFNFHLKLYTREHESVKFQTLKYFWNEIHVLSALY